MRKTLQQGLDRGLPRMRFPFRIISNQRRYRGTCMGSAYNGAYLPTRTIRPKRQLTSPLCGSLVLVPSGALHFVTSRKSQVMSRHTRGRSRSLPACLPSRCPSFIAFRTPFLRRRTGAAVAAVAADMKRVSAQLPRDRTLTETSV